MQRIKKRLWQILEVAKQGDMLSKYFDIFIMSLIVLNVIFCILGSMKWFENHWRYFLEYFELVSVIIFTIEYFSRFYSCTIDSRYPKSIKGRIKYLFTPMAMIDFVAIFPFYISLGGVNLTALRVLRLFRILRIAKMGRYYSSLNIIKNVLKNKKEELILTTLIMFFLLIMSSSLMYYAEHSVQPKVFSSIPASMWWAVVTLTTVGYGDVYPITVLGKIIAGLIAIIGIGMFALPTGIIGSGFIEEIEKRKSNKKQICPHCNKEIVTSVKEEIYNA